MIQIKYLYNKFLKICSVEGLILIYIAVYFGNTFSAFIALVFGLVLQGFIMCSDMKTKQLYFSKTRKWLSLFLIYFILGTGVKSMYIISFSNLDINNKMSTCAKIFIIFIVVPIISNYILLRNSIKI